MLVRERVRGDLLVQLDAKLQARPVELLRQRWSPDGRGTEHLVRWAEQNAEEVAGAGSSSSQAGGKSSSILMWMSAEEVDTNCPTLLGKRKPEEGQEENAPGSPNEGSLQEMREDVRTLVQRAARQMAQTPDPSILHTIHVLRAYATIASLAAVFKETGALDLLVEMLCNTDKQIRSNASKVLRALASHDAGSRTHILLALSQQDGMEQRMDFESRYTLLQLFAETSAEKQRISLEGIHLPQITGKRLFSLVKRYLRASSLLDQLTSDRPGKLRLQRQCDFGMAMGDLICELVRAMGWADESGDGVKLGAGQAYSRPAHPLWAPRRRRRFLVCSDFPHRGRYAEYLQHTLVPGMGVRMPENHQLLVAGDEGVFLQSILGTSSAQVYWHRLGRPHHVDWDALEIISCGERNEERAGCDWRLRFATEGGVRSVLACMQQHLSSAAVQHAGLTLLQEVVGFLHGLASLSKDLALLMCNLRAGELLNKVPEQLSLHSCMPDLKNHLTACEKYACLHNKMAASVVAGCMQIVLSQIDERRLSQRGATLPLLDVFLSGLAGACTGVEQNQDKCWERLEVSSNPQQAGRLTDGNPKSYWESSSSSGCHYITLHMRDGVLVRQLVLIVAGEDGSYMPAHVVVKGGEKPYKVNTELSTVNIRKTGGRILLLENATCYWPIIQILILRCHMGGIDTRVRGLEIQGTTSTCWAVFKEQLRRRTFLFYTSKAHTWGEQIHRKKKKLLQLLPWLNRTLSHEQEFAERFLPDGEAAQTLGRTCWEALICPLVERITTSGFHIVHLTLLLNKFKVPPAVQRFLERTWNDGDLVPRFCAVCLNLKRAMEEMFGQQAALSLALQEGICEGLLHLPFPNGIHGPPFEPMCDAMLSILILKVAFLVAITSVMKQFARYIDQLIGAELLDSSGAEPVEQLQQFLEWARCLADLELAASFEHFYRHYLANRLLLTLAPCWLENLVVDHIGACFPNRFPQQMLKSHSSSGSPGTAQRRLQWTWLGEAELQYGELNLRVSTLQMFILLQFNQREEIREEELRCRAGVSEHLLRRSLQPLTAQGGVLTLRPETGVLSVNPLCERAVTPLILSPAPAEDADIPALMEERHLLLQLIGRIMREEQEIHVDALVVKVLNRYRKLPESSPSCTATDVLSCVMSELRDGAIQRKSCSRLVLRCKDKTPPPVSSSPAPIMFHCDPSTPLPPQVSEFCSLPRVPSFPAETQPPPAFRTFRGK
ncbi:cullin-9-like [Gastrophryne carolinensis]